MGECLTKAAELNGTIEGTNWEVFDAVSKLTDDRRTAAAAIRDSVIEAMRSDEHVVQLGPALKTAQSKALRLLTQSPDPGPGPGPGPGPTPDPEPKPGKRVVTQGSRDNLNLAATKDLVAGLEREVKPNQDIRVNINWIIEEGETRQ
jgi:hypothetical protein